MGGARPTGVAQRLPLQASSAGTRRRRDELEFGAQTAEDAEGSRRTVALGQGGARRLGNEHRTGRREGAESVIAGAGEVLGPGEEFQVGQQLVARASAQGNVAGQRWVEICLVAEEILAARGE